MSSVSVNENISSEHLPIKEDNEIYSTLKEKCTLTEEQVLSFISLSPYELEAKLAERFALTNYKVCLEEACLLDTYVSAFWFFTNTKFSNVQVVECFSLLNLLLGNAKDYQMPLTENVIVMRNNLKKFVQSNDDVDCPVFSCGQLVLVTDYMNESLFQHYKLYQYLFSAKEDDDSIPAKLIVDVPPAAELPFPPPLDEGIPEDIYTEYVASPAEQNITDTAREDTKTTKTQSKDGDIPNDNSHETRETLLLSLKSEDVRKIVRDVSHEVLNDVKVGVNKKLKDRESQILPKITKR